jgi:hypothetical protein
MFIAMAVDRRKSFTKQPHEEYDIDIDFSDVVPLGADRLISGTVSAIKRPRKHPDDKATATSEILTSTSIVVVGRYNTKARFRVYGGVNDYEYQITVKVLWDNSAKLEEEVFVRVREE